MRGVVMTKISYLCSRALPFRRACVRGLRLLRGMPAVGVILLATAVAANAQQSFPNPSDAAGALVEAVRGGNRNAILGVLGRDAEDIISSGDSVADGAARERFLSAYDAKHQVTMEGDSKAVLIVGKDDFPFPIPLVARNGQWRFDTAAGREEILVRRVGRNELNAIETALAYVDAQNDYADKDRTGAGPGVYARRIISRPGQRDGLYWPTAEGQEQSPLGPFVAEATAEGYRAGTTRTPYHGYYYRILTRQGPAAEGGALDYVVNGKMIGGFGLVAYPAEYGNSGVMTFIVNHAGAVYQKDLGPGTARIAERMRSFDPGSGWKRVEMPERPQAQP
jgi:Protein of unknown function (DUF2950)